MTVNLVQKRHVTSALMCCLVLALSACGGGSGDSPTTAAASGSSSSAGNQAPTISGTPATAVIVGGSYSLTPTSSDPDGDTKTFLIVGKPSWASFNTLTGALTGKPTATGTHSGIVISVSDGRGGTASLPAFTITVASATGSAVLTWTAPTLNTDGTSLTDLTGYKVYYGTSTAALTSSVSVASGATTTTIANLPMGKTYYFAIASVSASGGEGNKSNVASKTI